LVNKSASGGHVGRLHGPLRECGLRRRRVAKPALRFGAGVAALARVAVAEELRGFVWSAAGANELSGCQAWHGGGEIISITICL
jgi:hypothetical protein